MNSYLIKKPLQGKLCFLYLMNLVKNQTVLF